MEARVAALICEFVNRWIADTKSVGACCHMRGRVRRETAPTATPAVPEVWLRPSKYDDPSPRHARPGQRESSVIAKEVRAFISERDKGTCLSHYGECQNPEDTDFGIDHIFPRAYFEGEMSNVDAPENLQLAHNTCNVRKDANLMPDWPLFECKCHLLQIDKEKMWVYYNYPNWPEQPDWKNIKGPKIEVNYPDETVRYPVGVCTKRAVRQSVGSICSMESPAGVRMVAQKVSRLVARSSSPNTMDMLALSTFTPEQIPIFNLLEQLRVGVLRPPEGFDFKLGWKMLLNPDFDGFRGQIRYREDGPIGVRVFFSKNPFERR